LEITATMRSDYLTQFSRKLAVITGIISVSAIVGVQVIAQTPTTSPTPTPGATTDEPTPGATTDEPTPGATTDEPTPGATTDEPTPGVTTDEPTPGATTDEPTPGATIEPIPDPTPDSTPAPGGTTEPTPGVPTPATPTPGVTPPTRTVPGQPGATTGSIVEVASTSSSFNTLVQAVEAAGLADTLSQGTYTVLAPTDQAFNTSLPAGTVEFLLEPENRDLLRRVLTYHVIPGEVTAKEFRTGGVKTLGGGVAVRTTGERVIVNNASVVQPNIQATNGIIHAVNRVLLPAQLRKQIASKLQSRQSN
jgi:uncharacterized surface protein with fasciclin (FAS1) repeats